MATAEQVREYVKLATRAQLAAAQLVQAMKGAEGSDYRARMAESYLEDAVDELLTAYGKAVLDEHLAGEADHVA